MNPVNIFESQPPLGFKIQNAGEMILRVSADKAHAEGMIQGGLQRLDKQLAGKTVIGFQKIPLQGAESEGYCNLGDVEFRWTDKGEHVVFEALAVYI